MFDTENPMHLRLLAECIMAEVEAGELIDHGSECVLTSDAEARLLHVLAAAGCTLEETAAAMRLEGRAS